MAETTQKSTFLQKERALLMVLQKRGYAPFEDKHEACEMIGSFLQPFSDYVDFVKNQDHRMTMIQMKYEGEDYRNAVMALDRDRRGLHNVAIGSVGALNKIYEQAGLPQFSNVDAKDRYAVADLAGRYHSEMTGGNARTMDEAARQPEARAKIDHTARLLAMADEIEARAASSHELQAT